MRGTNVIAQVGKLVYKQINQTGFTIQPAPLYTREHGQSCNKDGERDGTQFIPVKPCSRCNELSFVTG